MTGLDGRIIRDRGGEGPGALTQPGQQLARREIGIARKHQRRDARDDGRGEARAQVAVDLVGVDVSRGALAAVVGSGVQREQAGTAVHVHAVAARRGQRDLGAQAAETHFAARVADRRHRGDARAIGRRRNHRAFVAGGNHHEHLARGEFLDDFPVCRFAGTDATQAGVEHARGSRVGGYAGHRESASPTHAGQDVAVDTTAFAQHTHRQDEGIPAEAGDTGGVVGNRPDHPGHAGAMPRTRGRIAVAVTTVRLVGGADPVTRVRWIVVAAVAVVDHVIGAHEIEPGQQLAATVATPQVRMVVEHAGVQHRYHDTRDTQFAVPGVDRVHRRNLGVLQVPLAAEPAVVGAGGMWKASVIDGHVLHGRIGAQRDQRLFRAGRTQLDGAGQQGVADFTPETHRETRALGEGRRAIRARGQLPDGRAGGITAQLDDDAQGRCGRRLARLTGDGIEFLGDRHGREGRRDHAHDGFDGERLHE